MQTKKVFATGCKKTGYMVSFVVEVRGNPRPLMKASKPFWEDNYETFKETWFGICVDRSTIYGKPLRSRVVTAL